MADHGSKGTIVFVHGAFCDGSIWKEVFLPLAHEGFRIHAAQLPLTSFADDVASLNRLLDHASAPILLVGHSYGGAPVCAAGTHKNVKALAFVAALVPDANEPFGAILAMNPTGAPTQTPDAAGYLWLDADYGVNVLGQDLHRGYLNLTVATQKPTHASVFEGSVADPAWKHKPSAFLVTTEDRVLSPVTQRALVQRIGARSEEIASSHLVVLSQPEAVTNFVRTSAQTLQA